MPNLLSLTTKLTARRTTGALAALALVAALVRCSGDDSSTSSNSTTTTKDGSTPDVVETYDAPDNENYDSSPPKDGGGSSDASDAAACPSGQVLRYETPGCGMNAHPRCGSPDQDACAVNVCGCDGKPLVKCDYASAPWTMTGCSEDGGGDSGPDSGKDSGH
jgi:hypothetical protein